MKILILGGTGFAGRILTENLMTKGIYPVLFNRGKRNPDIFPELRKIIGDRETDDIKEISKEEWDVVVDFSGMFPDNVELITEMLKGKAGRYVFVSSASAYVMEDEVKLREPIKEDFETYPCTDEQRKDKDVLATYNRKKAECERVLLGREWLDVIIFRPALIYGRYDPSDRFYYWLYRAKHSSWILMPDNGVMKITNTYSEDFARLIEQAITIEFHNTVYNAVTHDPVNLKDFVVIAAALLQTHPEIINAPAEFFTNNNIKPWTEIPMWLGGPDLVMDNSKLLKDFDIKFHSFEESIIGCTEYYSSLGWKEPKYGLTLEKEKELIKLLKKS